MLLGRHGPFMSAQTASVAIPAGISVLGSIGGAAAGKGGGTTSGQRELERIFKGPAKQISRDVRFGLRSGDFSGGAFDAAGNFVGGSFGSLFEPGSSSSKQRRDLTFNEKAIAESQNFFANLFSNPDINQALDAFRSASAAPDPETGLISDPLFDIVSERRLAEAKEAARATGGLFSTSAQESLGRTSNELIAEQQLFEDERRRLAAASLFDLTFQRGQAGLIPTQTFSSILSSLGGATPIFQPQQFSNAKGQAGNITGQGLLATGEALGNKGQPEPEVV